MEGVVRIKYVGQLVNTNLLDYISVDFLSINVHQKQNLVYKNNLE